MNARGSYKVRPVRDRFLENVKTVRGCWEWQGARGRHGYGVMGIRSEQVLVHRYSYELYRGPIPAGLHVDHLCRNRVCVNPAHLDPVTPAENVRRAGKWINRLTPTCKWGHPVDEDNIKVLRDGSECCLQCYRDRNMRPRISQKERYSNGNH